MALVKFIQADLASFSALETKDQDTLYFISGVNEIWKGDERFTGGKFVTVTSYPASGEINTIYVNTTDGSARFFNGQSWQIIVKPSVNVINGVGLADELVSSKAVVDYVTKAIADVDLSAVTNRLDTIEGQIQVINGTGDGSIAKALADAKAYTDTEIGAVEDTIDEVAADVAENASAITALESGKADKATTLAGYGIADAYTKTETNTAIATAVANVDHLKREIVEALPAVEDADENTIYMVEIVDGKGNQKYEEFMLVSGAFEKIGDSAVDLTNYATKEYADKAADDAEAAAVSTAAADASTKADKAKADAIAAAATDAAQKANTAKSEAIAEAATDATTKANQALADAKTYADGLGKNYATAAQGAKADTALQKADVTTGSANGTISVQGDDVAVKGLGSAAFAETSAFDAAGAASTAKTQAVNEAKAYADSLAGNYATKAQGTKADEAWDSLTWKQL